MMCAPQSTSIDSDFLPPKTRRELPIDYEPSRYAVVVAKGNKSKTEGNAALRQLCQLHINEYLTAKNKNVKTAIVSRIFDEMNNSTPDGIGFVKYHDGRWYESSEHGARDIISARFRDCNPDSFKSSNKSKVAKRRINKTKPKSTPNSLPAAPRRSSAASVVSINESTSNSNDDDLMDPIPLNDNVPEPVFSFGVSFGSLFKSLEDFSHVPIPSSSTSNRVGEKTISFLSQEFSVLGNDFDDLHCIAYVVDDMPEGAASNFADV